MQCGSDGALPTTLPRPLNSLPLWFLDSSLSSCTSPYGSGCGDDANHSSLVALCRSGGSVDELMMLMMLMMLLVLLMLLMLLVLMLLVLMLMLMLMIVLTLILMMLMVLKMLVFWK